MSQKPNKKNPKTSTRIIVDRERDIAPQHPYCMLPPHFFDRALMKPESDQRYHLIIERWNGADPSIGSTNR